ncbi:eukaryotic translation initiation factor 4e type 2 [Stylonychia lemnae]|uniref:Eukaryotic translation initiation factor 4e type 2 n=1 Tax=Stylonychia lemnae TaxID=5949 RepID=A0A078B505_STYLE|nr:eukaryotic translation initiation factor 4e type 2 [Stylonychia lemnae]|eukprot:CDW89504.1 eukaryotic translation initiation factor 4e type 2 [Stylonychia lemnae]
MSNSIVENQQKYMPKQKGQGSTNSTGVVNSSQDLAMHDPAIIFSSSTESSATTKINTISSSVIGAAADDLLTTTELEYLYTYWIFQKQQQNRDHHLSANEFESQIKPIAKFKTFVDEVKPMWEDEANKNGGRWVIRVNKGYSNKLWEDLTLAMIGEQFECENEIHGIVIVIKPSGDTIAIWNKNSRDQQIVDQIKQDLIRTLNLPEDVKMDYEQFFPDQKPAAQGNWNQGQNKPRDQNRGERRDYGQQQQQNPNAQNQQNQGQQPRYKPKNAGGGQGPHTKEGGSKGEDQMSHKAESGSVKFDIAGSKSILGLLTMAYIAVEGYHLVYNFQVVSQLKDDPYYPQQKLERYTMYLIFSLLPQILVAIYGLTICMFKDTTKILRNAWLFRLITYLYDGLMLWGLYKIWYDWWFEHHHNHRMMSYIFYHDFLIQWGVAFIYSLIFRSLTKAVHIGPKSKRE